MTGYGNKALLLCVMLVITHGAIHGPSMEEAIKTLKEGTKSTSGKMRGNPRFCGAMLPRKIAQLCGVRECENMTGLDVTLMCAVGTSLEALKEKCCP
ncbi:unnamed protein product [Caenorhabditis sp. 36 PRJEB53466]|nr:unnamed protein product [Caenorhabditis sp. 36 PRJEB53466]